VAINKNFVVKNGLEVNQNLILANATTNKVGIGTSIPNHTLHVLGGIAATDARITGIATVFNQLRVGTGGTIFTVIAGPTGSGQSVGVGTANPAFLLDIRSPVSTGQTALYAQGDVKISGNLDINELITTTNFEVAGVSTFNSDVYVAGNIGIATNISLNPFQVGSGSTVVLVDSQGNVGIGTTIATSKLHVIGDILISGVTSSNAYLINNTQVISSARQLQNITSLDATTIATIETSIVNGPNTFNDIQVTGISTFVGLATFNNGLEVFSGVTTLGVATATNVTNENLLVSGVGTVTTLNSTNATLTNLSGTIGTVTTLNSESSTITNLSGTIGTVTTLNSESSTITNLSGTIGTVTTLNSTNATLTNINSSGISTLGVTSTTNLTTQQLNISGILTVSNLKYPTSDGIAGQSIVTDGFGNLSFAPSLGAFDNRIYVSITKGNDANDGTLLPVQTIKKAAQLASQRGGKVVIFVETGDYVEDNPIILYEDVSIIGDNIRNTIVRPQSAGKDMFRVRNGAYVSGITLRDYVISGVPQYTFDYALSFDDPLDATTSRVGYAVTDTKPVITRSPYIQNCSVISFLGGNGILVDGNKVVTPNTPTIPNEAENPAIGGVPEQGKSIVANAFTLVSFGGIGYRAINDGYAQLVSCFQIFCQDGSLSESGGYLSITNSATNFGTNALRSKGFSPNSFVFDRGIVAANSVVDGNQSLKIVGLGGKEQTNYVLRFYNQSYQDVTGTFKSVGYSTTFDGVSGINTVSNEITITSHNLTDSDTVLYIKSSSGAIGGLVDKKEYFVDYVGINTIKLYEDISLTKVVDLTNTSSGIHTLQKSNNEFFVENIPSYHNNYQELTLDSSSYAFVPGRLITQTFTSASGYAVTFTSNKLLVSVQSGVDFNTVGTIQDHSPSPQTASVTSVVGITSYYTIDVTVGTTETGESIQNVSSLPENYFCYFHRPSIINSSSHTWEYVGSGNDYNALPQNGGIVDSTKEQVSERGGRVYTSGTNELGDFKVGDAITAFNRTGNIIFNNTVTIGELTSLKFKIGNSPEITEVSADIGLGDNEPGGAQDYRLSTQKAQRTFLNDRLGDFIDKNASTSSVPNAVVILNSSGQINSELISVARESGYYISTITDARLSLVDDVPPKDLLSGDLVVESTGIGTLTYRLINDRDSQYLVLSDSTRNYNFTNGTQIVSANNNVAIGIVTTPHNVGYGTTGLVKGVLVLSTLLSGGSGYVQGTYNNVSIATSTGIGTSAVANVTVNSSGQIIDVDFVFGGRNYAANDILRITSVPISGTNYATVTVNSVETRLYTKLTNNTKFAASITSPDFISDNDAIGLSTDISVGYSTSFNSLSDIDTTQNRIIVGVNTFSDGDPVIYNIGAGSVIGGLTNNQTYYIKKVGITSVELYTNYGLLNILDLTSTGTGTHSLTRSGVNTSSNFITLLNHGYSTGDAVKVVGVGLPSGLTSGYFYFIGSVITNGFTLHSLRGDALASINGLSVSAVSLGSTGSGIATFTKQNVQYNKVVNTSSTSASNYSVISGTNIDASNIISGTISPTRLGSGSATIDTFLSGNSTFQKVVKGVGIGTTEPFTVTGTSFDASSGITTYYGNVNLKLNRVDGILGDVNYTNVGVSKFKKSTFAFDGDGAVRIKTSAQGGDVDADKLDGQDGSYYQDPNNLTSPVPLNKGGTNLTSTPVAGTILVGNGAGYDLTNNPNITGNLTAVSLGSTFLTVSGITTLGVTSTTNLTSQQLNVTGVCTFATVNATNFNSSNVISAISVGSTFLTVSGITTLGVTSTTNLTSQQLNVTGVSTFSGITTHTTSLFGTQASFSGIVTANKFIGDGSSLSNVISGVELRKNNVSVGTALTVINVNGGTLSITASSGVATITSNAAGSDNQVQYRSSGDFAGSSNLTFNGTNLVVGSAITINSTGIDLSSTTLDKAVLKNYVEATSALGNTGTAATINLANGNVFTATLTGNCTFTFTTGVTSGTASFTLILANDTTAGRTIVWPASVKWPNNVTPSRTTTANATDIWSFFTPNNGTTWYGNIALYNFT
jgi:hypothetical protein